MFKKLFTTTALVAAISVPAFATETKEHTTKMFEEKSSIDMQLDADGFIEAQENTVYGSDIIGSYVYNGVGDNAENIGDVNDLIVTTDGKLRGVIVGVGGFLGIGEKDVAISTDKLMWKTGPDGERWIVSEYSREKLEAAPEFQRDEDNTDSAAVEKVDNTTTGGIDTATQQKTETSN